MADPEADAVARAHDRLRDIIPIELDNGQRTRLTDVLHQVWYDGYEHGRGDEADGQPAEVSDEDRIRDAMAEATDNPGRAVTR